MKNLLLLLFLAFACTSHHSVSAQAGSKRSVSGFDEIAISGGFDKIILREGASESVEIQPNGADLDKIITEVEGNSLKLGFKKGYNCHNCKVKIVVTFKSIREINNSGSSDVATESTIRAEKFVFNSSGSGDFVGDFNVADLRINISGSSDMDLRGVADDQMYAISGSGDVDAHNLKGKTASVAISGSGDVDLNVSGRVKTAISGSGDVSNHH